MRSLPRYLNRRDFVKSSLLLGGSLVLKLPGRDPQKQIALIGDSIRLGYQSYVISDMGEEAQVWGPEYDSGNTIDILVSLKRWITTVHYDIIHLNSGLNDLRTVSYSDLDNLVPVEYYTRNIEKIMKLVRQLSLDSILIWATTTPVLDDSFNRYHEIFQDYHLRNEDVIRYNAAATELVSRMGVAVNDLYSFMMTGDPSTAMRDDGVHYNDFGNQLLGDRIRAIIEKIIKNL